MKPNEVPCELCGTPTPMTGTKRCDRCWELETRIHADPDLARKILRDMIMSPADDCYACAHRRNIPGDMHIGCANPDPAMEGHPHGIANGWFFYPLSFDPIWKVKACANFEPSTPSPS